MGRTPGSHRRGAGSDIVTTQPGATTEDPELPRWLLASGLLALIGIGVAAYLTLIHYDEAALICGVGDCHTVQNSRYAELAGVPVAILGLAMYVTIFVLVGYRWRNPDRTSTLTSVAFAIALAGTGYAACLTWLEIAVIKAICQWCVVSAIVTSLILVAEGVGVRQSLAEDAGG